MRGKEREQDRSQRKSKGRAQGRNGLAGAIRPRSPRTALRRPFGSAYTSRASGSGVGSRIAWRRSTRVEGVSRPRSSNGRAPEKRSR